MDLKIAEITYENLFKLISLEEDFEFCYDDEFLQETYLEIQNEHNEWVEISGLIKKQANLVEISVNDNKKITCADSHLFKMRDGGLLRANDLVKGVALFNSNAGSFTVSNVEKLECCGDVYDIEVDNVTHLYQTADGFVHHNTLLTSAIIKYANMLNMRTLTIVPSASLLKQTHDYIKQFEIPVGMYGNGKKDVETKNIVATWQTLQNNKSFIRDFECIIWDECLHPSSKIKMSDDSEKPIDTIKIGDFVKTLNESSKEIEIKQVLNIHKNLKKSENQKMFKLTLEDDSVIELTGNHEVMTQFGWKRTDELTLEDDILCY